MLIYLILYIYIYIKKFNVVKVYYILLWSYNSFYNDMFQFKYINNQ